jgi:hypothetical protein
MVSDAGAAPQQSTRSASLRCLTVGSWQIIRHCTGMQKAAVACSRSTASSHSVALKAPSGCRTVVPPSMKYGVRLPSPALITRMVAEAESLINSGLASMVA